MPDLATTNGYKFSASRSRLGFETNYVEHPRSRWHGSPYWVSVSPDAVPDRVRTKAERRDDLTAAKIAANVKPALDALDAKAMTRGYFCEPVNVKGRPDYIRRFRATRYPWNDTEFSLAINADFAEWMERLHGRDGEWVLTFPQGVFVYVVKRKPVAVVMPIRLNKREMEAIANAA